MASRSEWMKIYYQANREQRLAYARTYYENNVAKRKDYIKAYRQENRARWVQRKRLSKVGNEHQPPWITKDQQKFMDAVYEVAFLLTELTGVPYSVDHVMPLTSKISCGLHVPWNLRVITAEANRIKGRKLPTELSPQFCAVA